MLLTNSSSSHSRNKTAPQKKMRILYALSLSLLYIVNGAINCLNEAGNPVPYWAIFKLPQGTQYYYYDQKTGFTASPYSLNDTTQGALTNTMQQIWLQNPYYAFYNDEFEGQTEYNYTVGHSKGIWIWQEFTQGIFIQHSLPNFPAPNQQQYTGLPSNLYDYGQHLFCISTDISEISQQFQYVIPQFYDTQLPPIVSVPFNGEFNTSPVCINKTLSDAVTVFAKTAAWNADLYADCIAPVLSSPLSVESWQHGDYPEGAACQPTVPYNTVDIQTLNFGIPSGSPPTTFSIMDDHSKWAIGNIPIVCFGDINRVTTQYKRNGAAICIEDGQLWKSMTMAILTQESC